MTYSQAAEGSCHSLKKMALLGRLTPHLKQPAKSYHLNRWSNVDRTQKNGCQKVATCLH